MRLKLIQGHGEDEIRPRVLVPRPPEDDMCAQLDQAGFEVIPQPLTCTYPLPGPALTASLKSLENGAYAWLVITSARTLKVLSELDLKLKVPPTTKIAAVGPKCAYALRDYGLEPTVVASAPASALTLLQAFHAYGIQAPTCQYNSRVLIPGSQISSNTIPAGLRENGWTVETVPVYTTGQAPEVEQQVLSDWMDGKIDAAVITAGSVARALVALLGPPTAPTRLVTIGKPSAKVANDLGLPVHAIASEPTPIGIARALHRALLPNPCA